MDKEFRESEQWKDVAFENFFVQKKDKDGKWSVQSFSGHETNKLFMSQGGNSFYDLSALAGVDSDADGRAFALFDYDRDGWQDIVLVNSNSPQLEIFHNQMGMRSTEARSIGFRLEGGSDSAVADAEWSNRDAIGALITVHAGGKVFTRELRCGEGLGAQNSDTLVIGIGQNETIDSAKIAWPSGKQQTLESLEPGTIVSVKERGGITIESFQSSKDASGENSE